MATEPAAHTRALHPERRTAARQRVPGLLAVRLGEDNGGIVMDAGTDGLAVQAVYALPVGESMVLRLSLPNGDVEAACEVTSSEPQGRIGLHLGEVPAADRRTYDTWLEHLSNEAALHEGPGLRRDSAFTIATQAGAGLDALHALIDLEQMDSAQALDVICQAARERMRAGGVALTLLEGGTVHCHASSGKAPPVGSGAEDGSGLAVECIRGRRALIVMDTESDTRVNTAACRTYEARSVLAVPILAGGRVTGVVEAFCDRPMAFNGQDQVHLAEYAGLAAGIAARVASPARRRAASAAAPRLVTETAPAPAEAPAPPAAPLRAEPLEMPKRMASPAMAAPAGRAELLPAPPAPPQPAPAAAAASHTQHPPAAPAGEKPAARAWPQPPLKEPPAPAAAAETMRVPFSALLPPPAERRGRRAWPAAAAVVLLLVAGWLALQNLPWQAWLASPAAPAVAREAAQPQPTAASAEAEAEPELAALTPSGGAPSAASAARPSPAEARPREVGTQDVRPQDVRPAGGQERQPRASTPSAARPEDTSLAPAPAAAAPAPVVAEVREPERTPVTETAAQTPPPAASVLPAAQQTGPALPAVRPPAAALAAPPVTSRVEQGTLTHRVQPVYPQVMRASGVYGEVLLKAQIRRDGQVGQVTVVSGHPVLAQAAVDAVRRWRYTPFRLNQQPVEAEVEVRVVFSRSQ